MRNGAATRERLLADGHADALLEFEAHQCDRAVEQIGRFVDPSCAEVFHDVDKHLWKSEPRHRADRAGHQLLEQEHAAEPTEDAHWNAPRLFKNP